MRRWFWTLVITMTLGLAIGCGDKKSGNAGSSPTTPTDPTVPPTCTTNCTGYNQGSYKSFQGDMVIQNSGKFERLLEDHHICARDGDLQWYFGSSSCSTYDFAIIRFTVTGNYASVDLYTKSDWAFNYVYRNVAAGQLYPINNNTGFQVQSTGAAGTFAYNGLFQAIIENQNLDGNVVRIKLRYRDSDIGYVDAHVQ